MTMPVGTSGGRRQAAGVGADPSLVVRCVIPGDPVPKGRPRKGASGSLYTPERTAAAEEAIGWQLRRLCREPNDGDALGVRVVFRCSDRRRRDLDNLVKLVFDAANEIVWTDDSQVTRLEAQVVRGDSEPGIELEVYVA